MRIKAYSFERRRGAIKLRQFEQVGTHFLLVNEVAKIMRVSNMTIYRLINSGELAATKVGKSYRIDKSDVDNYLAKGYTQAG